MTLVSNLRTCILVCIAALHSFKSDTALMPDNYWGWTTYLPCPPCLFTSILLVPMLECTMSTFTANVDTKILKYL